MTATRRTLVIGATLGLMAPLPWLPTAAAQDAQGAPLDTLIAQAASVTPDALFVLAARLFAAGRRDEAVTWFYIAQLRMRFRLAVAPDLPLNGEPAAYGALFETIGPLINGWAFGDVDRLAMHLQEALDWDSTHANAYTPKLGHEAELERVRSGLAAFRANVLAQKDGLRRERSANGLENH